MAESFVDSVKIELIKDRVWQRRSQLELAVVEYLGWFNNVRLHESLGDLPPVESPSDSPSPRTARSKRCAACSAAAGIHPQAAEARRQMSRSRLTGRGRLRSSGSSGR